MPKTYGQPCPVACALDVAGDRWALLIVRDLLSGPRRFADLQSSLAPVAPNVLSQRLKDLEQTGVVVRTIHGGHPPRTEYTLTEKGYELGVVVGALAAWGARHALPGSGFVHSKCGTPLEVRLHCAKCRRPVGAAERRLVAPTDALG